MITIRKATLQDLDILHANNMAMAWESEQRKLDDQTLRDGLKNVLTDSSKGFYIVAEKDGKVLGNLMITVEWSDWRNAPMWWFQSVYVIQEARKQGVFATMYRFVEQLAHGAGVKELRLYVEKENNSAQRVYESLGMKESHYLMYEVGL